jgi:hypothetical protein
MKVIFEKNFKIKISSTKLSPKIEGEGREFYIILSFEIISRKFFQGGYTLPTPPCETLIIIDRLKFKNSLKKNFIKML